MAPLYHRSVGFPGNLRPVVSQITLRYSYHARQEATSEKYGVIVLPETLDPSVATLIEAEVDAAGWIVKGLYRQRYNDRYDLCLVVLPGSGFVKTVWLNRSFDAHHTLRRERYAVPA